jgi:hypothetical protein
MFISSNLNNDYVDPLEWPLEPLLNVIIYDQNSFLTVSKTTFSYASDTNIIPFLLFLGIVKVRSWNCATLLRPTSDGQSAGISQNICVILLYLKMLR